MKQITRTSTDGHLMFWCVGCDEPHAVPTDRWQWNGDRERPTLSPSILIRTGHYVPGHESGSCWCTHNTEHSDDPAGFACSVCHSFVKNGQIQFLSDCTHKYAGQTVALEPWEP